MSPNHRPSTKLLDIYDSLPPTEQRRLVSSYLAPLLDSLPAPKSASIVAAASTTKDCAARVPALDIKQHKIELQGLLAELDRDAKRAILRDRSRKEELLEELANSLVSWLPIIWSVAYEHRTQFETCHRCLLFCADVLKQVATANGGCKCAFATMHLPVIIKKQSGKVVRTFELDGAHELEEVIFWIWRDMFLTMLSSDQPQAPQAMREMMEDMEETLGWNALERMLYGGKHKYLSGDGDTDESGEESDASASDDEVIPDDGDSDYTSDEDSPSLCHCSYHASHWPSSLNAQVLPLRKHACSVLSATFTGAPSLELYSTLVTLSDEPTRAARTHRRALAARAGSGPDALAAALEVHALESEPRVIAQLLDAHAPLLRPRDAAALSAAVRTLGGSMAHRARALALVRTELLATARDARAALRGVFPGLEDAQGRTEAQAILALPVGAPGRAGRIEGWADAAAGPAQPGFPHAMAFAAAIMGVPVPHAQGGAGVEVDALLDLDPDDPDLEDLREEYRPRLRERWEGWVGVCAGISSGSGALQEVYSEAINLMPFIGGSDMVDELIARLVDRPSKHYVCDILEALSSFVKAQQKKARAREKKEKNREAQPVPHAPGTPSALPGGPSRGGLDDVD